MIVGISRDRLSSVWHHAWPLLKKALHRVDAQYGEHDILGELEMMSMQLWMMHDLKTAWLTEIVEYPKYKVFTLIAAGGQDMKEWLTGAEELATAFASHHGCKYIEIHGRPGWTKALASYGYSPAYVTLRKEI